MKIKIDKDKLNKESEEWKSKYLRALADYQNLERRTNDRLSSDQKNAVKKIVLKLLPVIDDLEKAQSQLKDNGIKLILDKFLSVLKSENIERKGCLNEKYDEKIMECTNVVDGEKEDQVVAEIRLAYFMGDEVIRTAQVIVSKVQPKADRPSDEKN